MDILAIFKHLFVPHEQNDYKPHFFREFGVSLVIFSSVFLLGASFGSSLFLHRTVLGVEISSGVLIDLTNESRLAYNQPSLIRSDKLDKAAELKGKDMAEKQYFSHDSPEGLTPWHWIQSVGYNFLYAGENLAIDFTEATDVEKAWLESPAHRANIMNIDFREIGIAVVEGVYRGTPTMYIVQMFGTPAYGETASSLSVTKVTPRREPAILADEIGSSIATETISRSSVEGSTTEILSTESSQSTQPTEGLEHIVTTQETAIVKNMSVGLTEVHEQKATEKYSTWYGRLLFNGPEYVDIIYKTLLTLVAFGLVTLITIEVRKQHPKHILYGVLSLVLLLLFIYINQSLIF
ncbi:MAG: hypothetical protein KBC21_00030 [Candidatus Pacebacteria bacterium]|nr:hypothetical protein [Candidatus Paceibacterota bacterium]